MNFEQIARSRQREKAIECSFVDIFACSLVNFEMTELFKEMANSLRVSSCLFVSLYVSPMESLHVSLFLSKLSTYLFNEEYSCPFMSLASSTDTSLFE